MQRFFEALRGGWGVVLGLALVLCIIFGSTLCSTGVFIMPITEAFKSSNEQAGRIVTLFLITMTAAMPVAGGLLDRIGARLVMSVGALLAALGYWLAAHSGNIHGLTAAMALAGVGVGASTYVPAFALTAQWIAPQRQGLAFGMLLCGAAAGAIIFPMALAQVITAFGLRSALLTVALCIALCAPLLFALARAPNKQSNSGSHAGEALPGDTVAQALRAPQYWLWIAMLTLITLSGLGVFVSIVPYLISIGYSAHSASQYYAGAGAATFAGNLLIGALANRWCARKILLTGTVVSSIGIACLLAAHSGGAAIVLFLMAWGGTFNLANQLSPLLLMEIAGARNFGTLFGIGNLLSGMASALSPELVGRLVDTTHSYNFALQCCIAALLAALLPITLIRRQPQPEIAHDNVYSASHSQ